MTLESEEIPSCWWAVKGGERRTAALHVLRAVLRGFVERGEPPVQADLRHAAAAAGVDLDAALAELLRHDMLVADVSTGAILGAYPFSALPTAHQVTIAGLAAVSAMCAVDALGIPFMLKRPATIVSCDAAGGEPLSIRVEPLGERVVADPPGIVVFAGTSGDEGTAAACRCPFINFLRSAEAAATYHQAHPELDGRVLSLDDAVMWGRRAFENPDGLVLHRQVLEKLGGARR